MCWNWKFAYNKTSSAWWRVDFYLQYHSIIHQNIHSWIKGTQEEKEVAHEKFVQIQQAYEKLSTLKRGRAKANKKSQKEEDLADTPSDVKIEL